MFNSHILDVVIGIVFVFVLVSTICTAIREGIEGFLKTRAAYLERGIRELLFESQKNNKGGSDGSELVKHFFDHPMIFSMFSGDYEHRPIDNLKGLFARGKNAPSYIPSRNFAIALMDLVARGPADSSGADTNPEPLISLATLRSRALALGNAKLQRILLNAIDHAQGDINKVQAQLEHWFDSAMDRVAGWYRRATQWILLIISFVVVIALNIDCLSIIHHLYTNAAATTLVTDAAEAMKNIDPSTPSDQFALLSKLQLPIGWGSEEITSAAIGHHAFGWIMTSLAAMLGAPFWFDILNKIMVVRSTVKPHQKSPEVASADRQTKPQISQEQEQPAEIKRVATQ